MGIGQRLLLAAMMAGMLGMPPVLSAQNLRVWTTEEQPERLVTQERIAEAFEQKTGISVDVIPVTEVALGTRANAALAAGDLPDVIYHSLQYALPWVEAGILDPEAATRLIRRLGEETFAPGALASVASADGYATIPVNGWTQMIVYREDLFDAAGLSAPQTFSDVEAAIKALHNPPSLFGFVAATKVDEAFMSQVLEHVFLANGVSPVDQNGFAPLDETKTIEILQFYKTLADASPPGELFWDQARELYLSGQAAMIMWSPFILDELAGLRDSVPVRFDGDPTSRELARRSGIVTRLSGPSNRQGAAYANINSYGITSSASMEAAEAFVTYSLHQGYLEFLSMAPEGMFPARQGRQGDLEFFIREWARLPIGVDRKASLAQIYTRPTIDMIAGGLDVAERWGVQDGQLGLASKMNNAQIFNRVVRKYIDGDIDDREAVAMLNSQLGAIH